MPSLPATLILVEPISLPSAARGWTIHSLSKEEDLSK